MTVEKQIEEILVESHAYGFRAQVINWAAKFMDEGHDKLTAYELAFEKFMHKFDLDENLWEI